MMLKRIFSILIILFPLTFFSCAQGPNNPMGNWGPMMGYGYGGGFMWLIIANERKNVFIASIISTLGCKTGLLSCLALLSLFIIA